MTDFNSGVYGNTKVQNYSMKKHITLHKFLINKNDLASLPKIFYCIVWGEHTVGGKKGLLTVSEINFSNFCLIKNIFLQILLAKHVGNNLRTAKNYENYDQMYQEKTRKKSGMMYEKNG